MKKGDMVFGIGALFAVGMTYWLKTRKKEEEPPPPPDGTADLQIESIAITPDNPIPYATPYTATVVVVNHGDAAGSLDVYMGWVMDNAPTDFRSYTADNPQTITLGAGETGTIVRDGTTISGEWWDGKLWANDHEGLDGAVTAVLTVRP